MWFQGLGGTIDRIGRELAQRPLGSRKQGSGATIHWRPTHAFSQGGDWLGAALVALCANSREEELLQPGKPEGT